MWSDRKNDDFPIGRTCQKFNQSEMRPRAAMCATSDRQGAHFGVEGSRAAGNYQRNRLIDYNVVVDCLTRRWTEGPTNIYIYICLLCTSIMSVLLSGFLSGGDWCSYDIARAGLRIAFFRRKSSCRQEGVSPQCGSCRG